MQEILVEQLYYNPEYNGLHEIRSVSEDFVNMSGCCNYVGDTKTTITEHRVLKPYVENNLILIPEDEIAESKYLCRRDDIADGAIHVLIVKDEEGREINDTIKFYNNNNIIR